MWIPLWIFSVVPVAVYLPTDCLIIGHREGTGRANNRIYVIHANPFWISNRPFSYGLLVGIVALPVFLATLLERVNKAIDRAEEADRAKDRFILTLVVEC